VSQALRYDPWGTPRSTVPTGYTPFRFQGSWSDATVDLAWVVTRWYAPSLGRFISEDTLLGAPPQPDSRHLYAYAAGAPVGAWDPDGREKLNPVEQWFCHRHPWRCLAMKISAQWALSFADKVSRNDEETFNSLRHCIWSCLLTATEGLDWAWLWTWAQEVGDNKQQWADFRTDLHNNRVGRLLGRHVNETWQAWFGAAVASRDLCVGAWDRGLLWVRTGRREIHWSDGRLVKDPEVEWW
jgi:RHS repeat-associated protein